MKGILTGTLLYLKSTQNQRVRCSRWQLTSILEFHTSVWFLCRICRKM